MSTTDKPKWYYRALGIILLALLAFLIYYSYQQEKKMELEKAERLAELVQVRTNRKAELKQTLKSFDVARNQLPSGDVMPLSVPTEYGEGSLVSLEGDGEIDLYRSFLKEMLEKRIGDAERDIIAFEQHEQVQLLSMRADAKAVKLLTTNRFDPNALYLCADDLKDPGRFLDLPSEERAADYVSDMRHYTDERQSQSSFVKDVIFVHPNGGIQLIKNRV